MLENHSPANGQVERLNVFMAKRPLHYMAEYRKDWEMVLFFLTYAHNVQVHRNT